ncbi:P2X purinoceptor 7 [Holothuria leucospilota]|uniref:P2X purinoceptor 7 n=1 Tax=Holothuria leucospilota TaxID=206669 RepID=A0A9Q1HKS2_HOLLE|nr:P2X purinoceptor 7 [Holothuria leucospilota]
MAEYAEQFEGPNGYDFEPSMSEEQYNLMMATSKDNPEQTAGSSDNEPEVGAERRGNSDWCQCGLCHAMETRVESICCTEVGRLGDKVMGSCITLHQNFDSVCLNEDVLSATWDLVQYTKGNRSSGNLQHRHYRFIAYKMFTLWGHGHMGKGNRTPIPSCVVYQIRLKFPEPDGTYTGFSYADELLAAAMPV